MLERYKKLHHHIKHKAKKALPVLLIVAFVAFIGVDAFLVYRVQQATEYPEVKQLETGYYTFPQLLDYFKVLSAAKGPFYAFDVLRRVQFTYQVDFHLIGHVIGDAMYKKFGTKGIIYCATDFQYACSHSVVIDTLIDYGPGALGTIGDACKQAPGGTNAYGQCFHGLGHGVLAYNGYVFDKAIKMCETLSADPNGEESTECIGGATMEMVSGIHDPVLWAQESKVYFSDANPLAPCTSSYMPRRGEDICLIYLTPHLWSEAGTNPQAPTDDGNAKAMSFCNVLTDGEMRHACYGGFGKEFTGFANDRDIRSVGVMTDDQLAQVLHSCSEAGANDGVNSCIIEATRALYWGGTQPADASIRLCSMVADPGMARACFDALYQGVKAAALGQSYNKAVCAKTPVAEQPECLQAVM